MCYLTRSQDDGDIANDAGIIFFQHIDVYCETAVSPVRLQWSVQLSIKIDFENGLVSL